VVCIDLSETYRSIAKRFFPNALIVADRFYVIRLVNQYLMEAWKQLEPVGRKHRGLISLMRRKPSNLAPEQEVRLRDYFREHPLVGAVYDKLQSLNALLRFKHQKAEPHQSVHLRGGGAASDTDAGAQELGGHDVVLAR